jgi:hypothetical protein
MSITSMAAGPRARATDPTTSHTAADTTENRVAASQYAVARILEDAGKPLTDTQIAIKARWDYGYRFSDSRLRTARHELVESGHVKDVGTTKPDGHRSHMILWALA